MYIVKKYSTILLIFICVLSLIICYFSFSEFYKSEYPTYYKSIVEKYAEQFNVDKYLIYSVIRSESGFKKNSVSYIGAKGLMQITDETYFWLLSKMEPNMPKDPNDLFEEDNNIKYGTYFLHILNEEFDDISLVLAAYHAGRGSVKSWLKNDNYTDYNGNLIKIPFKDTNTYVEKTKNTYEVYKKIYTN